MAVFHYLRFRAFAHETEGPQKVRAALQHAAHDERSAIEETHVEGSHKNRILILEAETRSAPAAKRLFSDLVRDDPPGFGRLRHELARRVDDDLTLHLRLDKQAAYQGLTRLTQSEDAITVRAKLRSFGAKREPSVALQASLRDLEAFLSGVEERPAN